MKFNLRLIYFFIPLLFFQARVQAQAVIAYEQFTSEQGLSENVVYCLLKDKKGFIWAGTDYGLNRFDGYSFKKYFHNIADSSSLSNQSILSIDEDSKGNFWIVTYKSLNYFNPRTGKADHILLPGKKPDHPVQKIQVLKNGSVLILVDRTEAYIYAHEKKEWKALTFEGGSKLESFDLFQLADKRIGAFCTNIKGTGNALLLLNESLARWEYKELPAIFPFCKEKMPVYYFNSPEGLHFIHSFAEQSLRIYNKAGEEQTSVVFKPGQSNYEFILHDIEKMDSSLYWLATNKGLLIYDAIKKNIIEASLVGDSKSLPGNKELRCLLNDQNGNIWMGIFGEGLLRCNIRRQAFKNIALPDLVGERFLRMIFGLYKWSEEEVAAETGFKNLILIKNGKVSRRLSADELAADDIVRITTGRKMKELSPFQQKILQQWYSKGELLPYRFILKDDTSVISTHLKFALFQPAGEKITSVEQPGNYAEDDEYYWVSSFNGLFRITKKDFSEKIFTYEPGNPYSLSEPSLYHIAMDENKDLWLGTKGGGLNHYDRKQNRFYHYTVNEGLPDNVIYIILPDKKGNLWLTTNKGISRFNLQTKTFTNFSKRDGLLNAEFNRQGAVLMNNGTIYLSGTSGVDYFNPDDLPATLTQPAVNFSELKINNSEESFDENRSLRFSENNLSFSYTANDYIRPDLVYYRYRLKEKEPWTRVQGVNTVLYNALPAGDYRFEVQSSYDNHTWSQSAVYDFTIQQPWWKNRWFYVALALLTACILYFIYLYRIQQLKKMHQLRTKISQDLHDEVGATLTSISFLSEVARKQTSDTDAPVVKTLDKIGEYSREMIGEINDIVWAINPANDKFDKITDRMKNFALPLLSAKNIRLEFKADDELLNYSLGMEQRKNLYLVFKEAVNNAAKYADCTAIEVNFLKEKSSLVLSIADNGKGFNAEEMKNGNGLKNMKLRAKEIKAAFQIQSATGEGTLILLQMPITQNADMVR
ncbi:MAG: hypothetical protein IPQ25_06280 [Chitinophagaceae bacterium]|nr:hypothetical protein [Chitinophagaceae bacterium]